MKAKARKSCSNCWRLQAKLNAQQAELEAPKRRLAALEATVAKLQEQLAAARKNSATSSKPPSSDIVKPPKPPPPDGQAQRKIGGQPGHPKHERDPFPPEAINDGSFDYRIDLCPRCGHGLELAAWSEPRVIQQVDINEVPLSIQEHRSHPGWCSCCRKLYEGPLPIGIERGGLVGPKLTTLIAYLKGGLPCFVLDHPEVHPRCRPLDDLARATVGNHW
jgi:transposase